MLDTLSAPALSAGRITVALRRGAPVSEIGWRCEHPQLCLHGVCVAISTSEFSERLHIGLCPLCCIRPAPLLTFFRMFPGMGYLASCVRFPVSKWRKPSEPRYQHRPEISHGTNEKTERSCYQTLSSLLRGPRQNLWVLALLMLVGARGGLFKPLAFTRSPKEATPVC